MKLVSTLEIKKITTRMLFHQSDKKRNKFAQYIFLNI